MDDNLKLNNSEKNEAPIIFIDTETISMEELINGDSYTGGEIYMGEDEDETENTAAENGNN